MTKLIPRHTNGDSLRDHMNGKGKTAKKDNTGEKKEAQRKTREQFDYVNPGRDPEKERQQRKLKADKIYQRADQFDDTGAVRANQGASNMLPEVTAGAENINGVRQGNNLPETNIGEVTIVGDRSKMLTPRQRQIRDYYESIKEEELAKPALFRRIGAGLDLAGWVAAKTPAAMTAPILIPAGYAFSAGADIISDRNKQRYGVEPDTGVFGTNIPYASDNMGADALYWVANAAEKARPWLKYAKWVPGIYSTGSDIYTLTTGKPLL